jgi:hypothetical protein
VAIDLGRARAAFTGLAVPSHRKIIRVFGLDLVYCIKHYHTLRDIRLVFPEATTTALFRPPDLKSYRCHGRV